MLPTPSPHKYAKWDEAIFEQGYDSDGDILSLPYEEDEEEQAILLLNNTNQVINEPADDSAGTNLTTTSLDDAAILRMTLEELRVEHTFSFYFRNQPPSAHYIRMGLSPLYSRAMAMIDQLPGTLYTLGMDNLYTSVKLARAAWLSPKKVMIHGVIRKSGRGVPPIIFQEEVTSKEALLQVRNTIKVARLQGVEQGCDIVIASIYDTKPVYLLSNRCNSINWVRKERQVYHKESHRMVQVPFYRLNLIDFYNNNMGGVDIADQLRGYYRVDHWIRNRKWWWSIYWWCHQMLLTNSYLAYCMYMDMHKLPKISHKNFIAEVALAWLGHDSNWPRGIVSDTPRTLSHDLHSEETISSVTNGRSQRSSLSGSSNKRKYGASVTDSSLGPQGHLSCRLDRNLQHLPVESKDKDPYCQLHWWKGVRSRKQIMKCCDCDVNLCLKCYKPFHTVDTFSRYETTSNPSNSLSAGRNSTNMANFTEL